jgi:tetratricopeptide (TPR) repeat protein
MRPETKRRVVVIFGFAICGCVLLPGYVQGAASQEDDVRRIIGPSTRPGQWRKSDPLANDEVRPDAATPAAKTVPVGDTVSVRDLQLPAGAIKEFRRSEKCVGSGDFSGAVAHLQKALKADPQFVEAHNNLGASLMQLQRYEDAIGEFETAIGLDSKMEAPYRNKSLSLFLLRRYPEAEAAARRALQINPEHRASRYTLGRALAAEGSSSAEAERLLRDSLSEFPDARLPLAQVLLNRCANLDAAAELRTYLATNISIDAEKRRAVQTWLDLSSKGQVAEGCGGETKPAS